MKSIDKPGRSELEGLCDIFDIVDEDDRIVPSLVWTPAQLKSALANDSSMFDTVLITDVADVETAIGVLIIIANIMPSAVSKDTADILAAGTRAKSDHGQGRRGSLGTDGSGSDYGSGSSSVAMLPGESAATDVSVLVPRVVMVFDERLDDKACHKIRKRVNSVCEGIVMLKLEQTVRDLYGYVVLPGFARAARWQDMVKANAEGGGGFEEEFSSTSASSTVRHKGRQASDVSAGSRMGANRIVSPLSRAGTSTQTSDLRSTNGAQGRDDQKGSGGSSE